MLASLRLVSQTTRHLSTSFLRPHAFHKIPSFGARNFGSTPLCLRGMGDKDLYSVLGIDSKASQKEIQHAFRSKAQQYHPDSNKGKDAPEKMKEITEAYGILKDPETRRTYDFERQFGGDGSSGMPSTDDITSVDDLEELMKKTREYFQQFKYVSCGVSLPVMLRLRELDHKAKKDYLEMKISDMDDSDIGRLRLTPANKDKKKSSTSLNEDLFKITWKDQKKLVIAEGLGYRLPSGGVEVKITDFSSVTVGFIRIHQYENWKASKFDLVDRFGKRRAVAERTGYAGIEFMYYELDKYQFVVKERAKREEEEKRALKEGKNTKEEKEYDDNEDLDNMRIARASSSLLPLQYEYWLEFNDLDVLNEDYKFKNLHPATIVFPPIIQSFLSSTRPGWHWLKKFF